MSVELLDLSMSALESVGHTFCRDCKKLREVLLPATLMSLRSMASADYQLALLVLPKANGMGIGVVYSASVLSGLVGLGSVLTRPVWPAK
jgi:hypothetical protein